MQWSSVRRDPTPPCFEVALECETALLQEFHVGFTVGDQFLETVQGATSQLPGQLFGVQSVELGSSLEFHPFGHVELLVGEESQVLLVFAGCIEEVREESLFEFG